MGFTPLYFPATITTGNSVSSGTDLAGSYYTVWLEVPTMTGALSIANSLLFLQVSSDNLTYRRMTSAENNTFPVGTNDFQIASAVSNRFVAISGFGFRYVKVEVSGTVSGAVAHPLFRFVVAGNA